MKVIVQRVKNANLKVNNTLISEIDKGLLVLVGFGKCDTSPNLEKLAEKLVKLRIFEDENGKMNLDIKQIQGEILLVSNFTLYAETQGQNRPSFINALEPQKANELYEKLCQILTKQIPTKKGVFGGDMKINAQLDGPVTIQIEM